MIAIGGKHGKNLNERHVLGLYQVGHCKNDESYMNVHKQKQMVIQKVSPSESF